jgi:hypothetical protein
MRPYREGFKADVPRRMSLPHRQSVAKIAQVPGVVSHQVRERSSSWSRCRCERQPRAECFLSRL